MKANLLILILNLVATAAFSLQAPESSDEAIKWYNGLTSDIVNATQLGSNTMRIERLGEYVRKLGRRIPTNPDPRWHEAFQQAQTALLAIPGHAQYFADLVEDERLKLKQDDYRGEYKWHRYWYICETLQHLPSPETIQVLGRFLSDERDTPPPMSQGQDWEDTPANSLVASRALASIGLRDSPAPIGNNRMSNDALAKYRVWYEEIRSGKRAFSFIGQKVEYRFKADGTWETIPMTNPPDDAPKPMRPTIVSPEKDPQAIPSSKGAKGDQPGGHAWPWIIGAVIAILAGVVWLVVRSRRRVA